MSELVDLLKQHEGVRLLPYSDTVGKLTIGVGRNLTDNGISLDEAEYLLTNDIHHIQGELRRSFPWFSLQLAARQDALTDMAFNLGLPRFRLFVHMLEAFNQSDYRRAAQEMLASNWAKQVGQRAYDLATMVETGGYL